MADGEGIREIIQGVQAYQTGAHVEREELFRSLKEGQSPLALFITCSDSRIDPNLITQTEPGGLFIMRNAGNIVPPYGAANGGEGATIEYALLALEVSDIIVCGHSHCGAMAALVAPQRPADMPAVDRWLRHAEATRLIVGARHGDLSGEALGAQTARENVLVQIENLQTHPAVALRLAQGRLRIHGWMYHFETGGVESYEPSTKAFVPLTEPSRSVGRHHRPGGELS